MKTRAVVILVCLIAIVAIAFAAKSTLTGEKKTPVVQVASVQTGGMQADIMAQGSIVPLMSSNVSVLPGFEGQVRSVYVQVGDHVVKGQALASLDPTDEASQLEQAQADATRTVALYQLTVHPHRPEEITREKATLDFDRHSVEVARAQLEQLQNGPRPQEITWAQAQVDAAKATLTQAQSDLDYAKKLYDKELESPADLQKSQTNVDTAQGALAESEAQLDLSKAGSRPEQIAAAEAQYKGAESYYQEDLQTYRMMVLGSRPEEIEKASADMQKANEIVQEDQAVLARQTIRAPLDGVVTERDVNPGDVVTPAPTRSSSPLATAAQTLFVVADDSEVEFMANVDARFYPNVHVGQQANVTFETDLGETYHGTVARTRPVINPLVTQTANSVNSSNNPSDVPLTFDVWVRLPNPDGKITLGEIGVTNLTQQIASGVLMPQGALTPFSSGNGTVYVEHDGVVNLRDVKYGDVVGDQVRILSGVKAGEQVVVSSPFALADGMHVTPIDATSRGAAPMM